MPTTVAEAFAAVGLVVGSTECVRWGTRPSTAESGVYIISLTESLDSLDGRLTGAPLSEGQFQRWLDVCPRLTLDKARPAAEQLMNRVGRFWIPDEVILYIGLATSLSERLHAFYRTPIGARRPHSGGYFLKLLSNLNQLWVHYAPCGDFKGAEQKMLRRFCEQVSTSSKRALHDASHPFPFANLEWPPGTRKAHGLRGARKRP